MNSIDVRTEKANAIFRYRSFQNITTLFRFIEICVFLFMISTFYPQLPFSVRISADYFRGISFAGINPRFVFVIGNVIILTLLYKSRVAENDPYGKIDVYDEYVSRFEKSAGNSTADRKICRSQSEKMMSVENNDSRSHRKLTRSVTERKLMKNVECFSGEKPSPEICRSQSEKTMSFENNDSRIHRNLTSSFTERKLLNNVDYCGGESTEADVIFYNQSEKMTTVSQLKLTSSVTDKPSPEICRSQSEKMIRVEYRDDQTQSHRNLRRSVTEREVLKNVDCGGGGRPAAASGGVDGLSSEAFRRTVEAFIARQQQSLRDEELAPVPYVGA